MRAARRHNHGYRQPGGARRFNHALSGGTPAPTPPPTGFANNSAPNTALKAMLARVLAGTGRGKIVLKADSIGAGFGGATVSGTSTLAAGTAGARPYRPTAVLATELSGVSYLALDNSFMGDHNVEGSGGTALEVYDTRIAFPTIKWTISGGQNFPGGNYIQPPGSGVPLLNFSPTGQTDTCRFLVYNVGGSCYCAVDGGAPASISAPGASIAGTVVTFPSTSGITIVTLTASTPGSHTYGMASAGPPAPYLAGMSAYNSAAKAIDIINHAAGAATSTQQAAVDASTHIWNLDVLGYEVPDLTIIMLGLNDPPNSISTSTYTTNLQALITKAKLSGDVLLVSPHPITSATTAFATQTAFRDAAASLAASNNVAYMDLYSYFVSYAAISSRLIDGVHGNRGFYAEMGQVWRQCIQAMAA